MGRFTSLQIALLAAGCGLILSSIFFDELARRWENYRYPNAVHWQKLRIVPDRNQRIVVPGQDILVVKDADARLTLFLRPDDKLTPQSMVKDLCRRDGCLRSTIASDDDRAVATYKMRGASMQIVLMRLGGGALWIEYKGSPEGLAGFDGIIKSVSTQLAERKTGEPG